MTIVAHMDDDLLFINPAISQAIAAGGCVTAVFMVGGDNTGDFSRVQLREAASQAAYARMIGASTNWSFSTVAIGSYLLRRMQPRLQSQHRRRRPAPSGRRRPGV